MKAAPALAIAHPMQALVKYHGLKDWKLRIPYHDSISVNMDALWTKTSAELKDIKKDRVILNGKEVTGHGLERALSVVNKVRGLTGSKAKVEIMSENSIKYEEAKGLGFSSSGGAALAAALFKAFELDSKFGMDLKMVSRIARLFSGSACRSAVGGCAIWHAGNSDETSYAERIECDLDMGIVIVPLHSNITTEEAHREVETSPFFKARIKSAGKRAVEMRSAIEEGDLEKVMKLAEIDSLELHALTMTGKHGLVAYKPESIRVMSEIRKMRDAGINAYFSMQTGPSVFINTYRSEVKKVQRWLGKFGVKTIRSGIGEEVKIVNGD